MDIHVYLLGRLGNQLFQYAFAKSLQKKYGGKIYLNIYELKHWSHKFKHTQGGFGYDMANFRLDEEVVLEDVKPKWFANLHNPFVKVFRKLFSRTYFKILSKKGYLIWMKSSYVAIPEINSDTIFVCGFWQNIKYFECVEKELQELIVPSTEISESNKELYGLALNKESVCISIRGGNYLYPTLKEKFFVCDKEYFYNSIEFVIANIDNPTFIVFSDDIPWVKEYMQFEVVFPNCKFSYETGNDTVEEKLHLMTACKNFIISNSTFSWWAQFLAKNSDKLVIAPDIWFGDGSRIGLYQDGWKLININK